MLAGVNDRRDEEGRRFTHRPSVWLTMPNSHVFVVQTTVGDAEVADVSLSGTVSISKDTGTWHLNKAYLCSRQEETDNSFLTNLLIYNPHLGVRRQLRRPASLHSCPRWLHVARPYKQVPNPTDVKQTWHSAGPAHKRINILHFLLSSCLCSCSFLWFPSYSTTISYSLLFLLYRFHSPLL